MLSLRRILVIGMMAFAGVSFGLVCIHTALAQYKLSPGDLMVSTEAFRSYMDIQDVPIAVPTVIEVPLPQEILERPEAMVRDLSVLSVEPSYIKRRTSISQPLMNIETIPAVASSRMLIDGDTRTYAQFEVPERELGSVQLIMNTSSPITTDAFTLLLDQYVALPTSIEIRALTSQGNFLVVARRLMDQQTVRFPRTTASRWTITLTYGQPLRISEARLVESGIVGEQSFGVRFLAQPGHTYRVYVDPDRNPQIPYIRESPNLSSDQDILSISSTPLRQNPEYIIADADRDGHPDIRDNCVTVSNSDQRDVNFNGRGDACDDFDRDGVINSLDNCMNDPNSAQSDEDGDRIGDACDQEESRITERHAWIPWAGIGFAALVLVVLVILSMKNPQKVERDRDATTEK